MSDTGDFQPLTPRQRWWATNAIGAYLVVMGLFALFGLVDIFPTSDTTAMTAVRAAGAAADASDAEAKVTLVFGDWTFLWVKLYDPSKGNVDQGLLLVAILSGVLGSIIHAGQSFAAYVGNRSLKFSWAWWYLFRPVLGAGLGVLFYFLLRAGLMGASGDGVSPYGVAILGALAGCFSERATEKLREVFDALFRPANVNKDKLNEGDEAPKLTGVDPNPVPAGTTDLTIALKGKGFQKGLRVFLNRGQPGEREIGANQISETEATVVIAAAQRPASGSVVQVSIANPAPSKAVSDAVSVTFQ